MGEVQQVLAGMRFNRSLKVEVRDERLTDGAGAVLVREVLERCGVRRRLEQRLVDRRERRAVTHPLAELVTTRVALLALGGATRTTPTCCVTTRRCDSPCRIAPVTCRCDRPATARACPTASRRSRRCRG